MLASQPQQHQRQHMQNAAAAAAVVATASVAVDTAKEAVIRGVRIDPLSAADRGGARRE